MIAIRLVMRGPLQAACGFERWEMGIVSGCIFVEGAAVRRYIVVIINIDGIRR